MLDTYLTAEHDAVLWVDSDLVDYPADLPTRLAEVAASFTERESLRRVRDMLIEQGVTVRPRPAIVAPLALLSPTSGWPGRFYDIGGFIEKGNRVRMWPPYFEQQGEVIELDSVGCCYLAPASLYRAGVRYSPPVTDYYVEHFSVMQQARKRGYRVCCLTTMCVIHAWLPDYGLEAN